MGNIEDEEKTVYSMATDPIYIGTGGYTIGRVDNTIVRDPTTRIPKIPGSSVAGTWRYYVALGIIKNWKDLISKPDYTKLPEEIKKLIDNTDLYDEQKKQELKQKIDSGCLKELDTSTPRSFMIELINVLELKIGPKDGKDEKNKKNKKQKELFDKLLDILDRGSKKDNQNNPSILKFGGNRFLQITCAGKDNTPNAGLETPDKTDKDGNTGHCGHCLVCKAFGYSKKDKSWQGMLFFSDLNIVFFPVYTRLGVRWITSEKILKEAGLLDNNSKKEKDNPIEQHDIVFAQEKIEEGKTEDYINLGWLNLPYKIENFSIKKIPEIPIDIKDIIIVPDSLISHIINSNLEVRTSVSIDPITGAAKEGALFTSEAIPRGTVFYGKIRLFDRKYLGIENDLPDAELIWKALEDTKRYYEIFGIGGMTTRGFGRMKILNSLTEGKTEKGGSGNGSGE